MEKRQQELQFLGFSGFFKESFKIIFSKPKLFTQITLIFILPLSILYQLHQSFIYSMISSKGFLHRILWEFSYYLVILIPSLLSASAIVCAVTFLYAAKDVTFKKIRGLLPKMWKRVMITLALSFVIGFCYHSFIGRVKTSIVQPLFPDLNQVTAAEIVTTKTIIATIIIYSYTAGYAYIRIIRNLATVVSVIEDLSGTKAWIKSKNLIKGKIGVTVFLSLVFGICSNKIDDRIYDRFLGPDDDFNWRNGIAIGIPCLILLQSLVRLLEFVVYTVIYFSCKSGEVTRRVLTTQSHQINFKSIWWSVLDPLME